MAKIEYVLFDMDGLMIDSEKIYSDVTNAILSKYGEEMTWDMKAGCMGKPEREAALHLLSFFPDISLTLEEYLVERNRLQDEAWPTVPLLPGVERLITHLKKHNIPIAVATGSRRRNYDMKTGHLGHVFGLFEGRIPNPDIFLTAAALLGRDVGPLQGDLSSEHVAERARGLVFEDGLPGMQAGKRAGMNVIWVPDSNLLNVTYDGEEIADMILKSIEDFVPEEWCLPPYDE
ncbi:HAD-like protein [Hymenopellis radicata]|nr:HAD-like protein [Hymenopellis radicata]